MSSFTSMTTFSSNKIIHLFALSFKYMSSEMQDILCRFHSSIPTTITKNPVSIVWMKKKIYIWNHVVSFLLRIKQKSISHEKELFHSDWHSNTLSPIVFVSFWLALLGVLNLDRWVFTSFLQRMRFSCLAIKINLVDGIPFIAVISRDEDSSQPVLILYTIMMIIACVMKLSCSYNVRWQYFGF